MVIDFHTHTFPEKIAAATVKHMSEASRLIAFTDGSDNGLCASMRAAGVDKSVVLPVVTNPEKTAKINDHSAALNGRNGLYFLGGLHPDTPGLRQEAARVASLGLRGVKIHPVYQRTDICDARFLRLLDAAGENGLFVVMHAGLDVGFPGREQAVCAKIESALRQVGPVRLVLAHMGGWRQWEQAERLAAFPNVMIDTAFSLGSLTPTVPGYYNEKEMPLLAGEAFVGLTRLFGAGRTLFGTDSPWASQADTLRLFAELPFTAEERAPILYKNAENLLGLN